VYYPSDWLQRNKEVIKEAAPTGTGEDDYSLLLITSALGPTPKGTFPHASLGIGTKDLKKNIDVVATGYPSSNSGVFEVDTKPGLKIAATTIEDYFTFGSNSYDILQTGVNIVAHRGASGGGIFKDDALYGIVVTTNSNSNGSYINALTLPYIKKDFKSDTGIDFDSFINDSADTLKSRFISSYQPKIAEIISEN
jgi:hypothetical protein